MEADVILRLSTYFILISMSGFFSGSETAMFSLGRVQLMRMAAEGHPRVALIEQLLAQPRRLIATIFIGNEFVNIGASALFASLTNRYLHPYGEFVVASASTAISVTLILLFGEITPKNLAAKLVERWAGIAARPIAALAVLMAPVRWVIERIADAVVYLVGGKTSGVKATVGENEFRTMVNVVSAKGDLDRREKELIHNVFEFGDRRVSEVMTPAEHVFALPYDVSIGRIVDEVKQNTYSRIPIYKGRPDNIVGLLFAKDLIAIVHGIERELQSGDRQRPFDFTLRELVHPPYYVPRATKCEGLLRVFRRRRVHMAVVVDEYARFSGLVTMEDLLEEMFGEIRDEKEMARPIGTSEVPIR